MNRNILLQHPPKKIRRRFYERKTLHPLSNRVAVAREKINAAKTRLDTWRAVGAWLGDARKATACNRLALSVDFWPSAELIASIEQAELPPVMRPAPVCPSCLASGKEAVHAAGDCHGKPVAAVVCLAPDETVRPVAKPRNPRRTPYGALSLRRTTLDRLAQHRTGRTADALINALLDKWEQEDTQP